MNVSAYDIMKRFVGVSELEGPKNHPLIQWGFLLCGLDGETPDEVPWCSAVAQIPAHILNLKRSKSARARSWLLIGEPIELHRAEVGYDVVILKRGGPGQPGPDVIDAPGHVGYYAGLFPATGEHRIGVLGGNQSDAVNLATFPAAQILGVRRLL